ncbi:MAG TPA: hypothetical protein VK369_04820, partial [Segetibacter sp.]|nr:hypothetical protein [Segetibacter sp.]
SALSPSFYMLSFKRLAKESGKSSAPEEIKTIAINKFQRKSVLQAPLRQLFQNSERLVKDKIPLRHHHLFKSYSIKNQIPIIESPATDRFRTTAASSCAFQT